MYIYIHYRTFLSLKEPRRRLPQISIRGIKTRVTRSRSERMTDYAEIRRNACSCVISIRDARDEALRGILTSGRERIGLVDTSTHSS